MVHNLGDLSSSEETKTVEEERKIKKRRKGEESSLYISLALLSNKNLQERFKEIDTNLLGYFYMLVAAEDRSEIIIGFLVSIDSRLPSGLLLCKLQ